MSSRWFAFAVILLAAAGLRAADYPQPVEGDFILRDFRFASGEALPSYACTTARSVSRKDASGRVQRGPDPARHRRSGGSSSGASSPAGCSAQGNSRRRALLHRASRRHRPRPVEQAERRAARKFPRYGYLDMVEAQHRLLTEGLGVNHLRLVMGTSMGGMHTWLWGERYPDSWMR